MFVSFEGPEGGGKSTQAARLAASLEDLGYPALLVYEPGGTALGEAVRAILLDPIAAARPTARAEALLFSAARAQLVEDVIRPALARDDVVICDRFSDSSLAYQAGGRGLPVDAIQSLIAFATAGLKPDLTFLLDLDVAAGLARKASRASDRLEREAAQFHERVRESYLALAAAEPGRFVVVDARRPVDELAADVLADVLVRLKGRGAEE